MVREHVIYICIFNACRSLFQPTYFTLFLEFYNFILDLNSVRRSRGGHHKFAEAGRTLRCRVGPTERAAESAPARSRPKLSASSHLSLCHQRNHIILLILSLNNRCIVKSQ